MSLRSESRLQSGPSLTAGAVALGPDLDPTLETGAVGDGLRRMFDGLISDPMPKSLLDLCDALEEAFRKGELLAGGDRKAYDRKSSG